MRVAVVGAGIAGLGAAWALSARHEVHLFEASTRLGGHSNTVVLPGPRGPVPVDTGFIVYNERTYPHLVRLFAALGVDTRSSDMSFSFSVEGGLEYGGSVRGLLTQPWRLADRRYRRMVADIVRFRSRTDRLTSSRLDGTLGDLVAAEGFSPGFVDDYLVPMTAAIWSAKPSEIVDFPASAMIRFLQNHGLIGLTDRPQWRTVVGGSRSYVSRMAESIGSGVHLSAPVTRVVRQPGGVVLTTPRGESTFDHLVLAVHSDQALNVLGADADPAEHEILSGVSYQDNLAVLHSDKRLMPRRHAAWSSWNHMASADRADRRVSVTYWMNRLQSIDPSMPLFVSLNPFRQPDRVHARFTYAHPRFDAGALLAQRRLPRIQGVARTWFAGAWCGYGFHEDGLQSGLNVAAALGSPAPWHDDVRPVSSAPRVPSLVRT